MSFNFNLARIKGVVEKKKIREVFHRLSLSGDFTPGHLALASKAIIRARNYHYVGIILQEIHCTTKHQEIWKRDWGGEIYFSDGSTNSRGVAILLPKMLDHS